MTSKHEDDGHRRAGRPAVRIINVSSRQKSRYGVVATTVDGHVVSAADTSATITSLTGAQSMVTAFDAMTGAPDGLPSIRVAGHGPSHASHLGFYLNAGRGPTFTLSRDDVRLGDQASVSFADDEVQVRTRLLTTRRNGSTVRVGLGDDENGLVAYDWTTREVRSLTGARETTARIDSETAMVSITDDLDLSVSRSGQAEVRRQDTTFSLNPARARTRIICADGVAEITESRRLDVRCARSGWSVAVSPSQVLFEPLSSVTGRLVWNRGTGDLDVQVCEHHTLSTRDETDPAPACDDCGAAVDAVWVDHVLEFDLTGLHVRWSSGSLDVSAGDELLLSAASAVRLQWAGKDFMVDSKRVVVSAWDEDWYVTADGRIATGTSTVSAGHAIDGTLELTVKAADGDETTQVWARGVCIHDGRGLRTTLDPTGGLTCTPTTRADHSVIASPTGVVTVRSEKATVDLTDAGAIRLRDAGQAEDSAELTVLSRRPGRPRHATIVCGQRVSVDVTCFADHGFAWRTTDLGSRVGHSIRASRRSVLHELVDGANTCTNEGMAIQTGEARSDSSTDLANQ